MRRIRARRSSVLNSPKLLIEPLEARSLFAVDLYAGVSIAAYDSPSRQLSVNITVGNSGDSGDSNSYSSTLFLVSKKSTKHAIVLATFSPATPLAGTFSTVNQQVILPTTIVPGAYYVGVTLDSSNQLAEANEANNTAYTSAASVTVPDAPAPQNTPCTESVDSKGNLVVTGTPWNDAIQIFINHKAGSTSKVLAIISNGLTQRVSLAGVKTITINGGAGEDTLYVDPSVSRGIDLEGGDGDDTLIGSSGPDTINGGNGNDSIVGNGGNDSLNGGAGNDIIYGMGGNDTINGGAGNDYLDGGAGNDLIRAQDGEVDTVLGEGGNDRAYVDSASTGLGTVIDQVSGIEKFL